MSKKITKTTTKKVESGTEFVTKRSQVVHKTGAAAIVHDETTGNEKIQITHIGGGNINLNTKVNSEFAPNNKQTLVHGNQFSTTAGDNFENTKGGKEVRVEQDLTFITGSENFFTQPIAEDWIEKNAEIAAAKAAPEYNYGAVGNNTETEYANGGTVGEGGAVEGGNYTETEAHKDIPALMEAKAADIAATEAKMGTGGNIKMMSAKHLSLMAGTKAVTFDSGVMVPNARKVVKQYEVDGGKCKPVYTSVSTYESKDTSGSIPFGDVHISAAAKLRVVTGSGGVSIKSAGEVNINSTGRLIAGGSEVAIAGSNKSNTGRVTMISDTDMFQEAGVIATRVAPNINDVASIQHSFHTPKGVFTGDLHIKGNVTVEGPNGIVVPAGDVLAGSVSLKNHTHGGVCNGSGSTTGPNGSGAAGSGGGGSDGDHDDHFSGDYNDLTNKPDLFTGSYTDLTNVPTTFNTVSSFSGSYNDLTDQPTILDSAATLAIVAAAGYTDCEGTVTNVTTGPYLTGGGTITPEIGIDSACAAKWDSAASGDITGVTAGAGLSGGATDGNATLGIDSGILAPLDQSACLGIDCIGTVVASDISGFTSCTGTLVPSDIAGLTDCLGTITSVCGMSLLSGFASSGAATIGIRSGALEYLNQSACLGINCTGDITEVTTNGDYLTGGGTTGAINIGLEAACAIKWDNASAGGVTNVTGSGGICSTGGLTPDISIDAACNTKWDQSGCLGINCEGDITSVCGTAGLSGSAGSGAATIGIASGTLTPFDQSACLGLDCTGTVTCVSTGALLSGDGNSTVTIGINSGALDYLNQSTCPGINSIGTVEGVTTSTLLSGGGNSGCFNIGIASGALDYLNQSSCLGLTCTGTVTCVSTGPYLTGGVSTNGEIGINSACANKWNNAASGGVQSLTVGGGIIDGGTATDPNICIDSNCNTKWDQSTCIGLNSVGTVTGSTAGPFLSTNNDSTCIEFGINSGALVPFDQSACPGILCTGDVEGVTVGPYLTGGGESGCFEIGLDSACAAAWDAAVAGGVTGVTTSSLISGGGASGCVNIGIDSGALEYLNQSACPGLNKTGTVTGSTAGALLSTDNNSTCIAFGINSGALDYLNQSSCLGLDCVGTVTCVTGGVGIDHTAGPNPELSVDNTVVRTIGNQVVGGTKHFTSPTNFLSVSATGLITGQCITTGAFMEANAASPEVYSQGTVLSLNEGGCVVESNEANSTMIFGVATGDAKAPIVMGAEPVCMTGDIKVGDYITSSNKAGHGMKSTSPYPFGTIIAQAMESGNGDSFEIKAMIRKM